MSRPSNKEVRSQIYGVLVAHLRKHCLVDGDEIDVDRYYTMQIKIADRFEKQYCILSGAPMPWINAEEGDMS